MTKKLLLTIFLWAVALGLLQGQHLVKVRVTVPSGTRSTDTLFIAGNFNNWNPHHSEFILNKDSNEYSFLLQLPVGRHELKITKGSWATVQTTAGGAATENYSFVVPEVNFLNIKVEGWANGFVQQLKRSSASKNVRLLTDSFYMPQLQRYRRIWLYLPADYATSRKKYGVLYMHDGQNLFEDSASFSGEWGVDEALDTAAAHMIVVGIDNGATSRLNEYSPYNMERFGKGEGDAYLNFINQTLRPYINKHYRTKRRGKYNFIAGSSMGGLISMYAVLRDPRKWGGAGVFSPAFWVAPQMLQLANAKAKNFKGKIYLHAGGMEGDQMVPDMLKYFNLLRLNGRIQLTTVIRAEGRHNESAWRKEFPLFYKFISR